LNHDGCSANVIMPTERNGGNVIDFAGDVLGCVQEFYGQPAVGDDESANHRVIVSTSLSFSPHPGA
jgi:hypothetical protein